MSRRSAWRSMKEEDDRFFKNPKPTWCLAPIALGVGHGSQRRVLYFSREILMLHSPVFKRMLAEENGFRESGPNAVIELPDDDPEEFDRLLQFIFYGVDTELHRTFRWSMLCSFDRELNYPLRLASKYQMEDLLRFFYYYVHAKKNFISSLSRSIQWIDGVSLPRMKALVFQEVCTRQQLDKLRSDGVWNEISATLRLELTEHYHDDQKKANGRKGFCSIVVPEIQWPNLLTFESPAPEHCGGVASLRLIVGRGKEKRVLHCSRELIFENFSALRERLHNCGDSLELEDDGADSFVHYMNWKLKKRPWDDFSAHQQSAMLCLGSKYRGWLDVSWKIDSSKEFTLCHKLYLAEQCRLGDLQKKYADEIFGSTAKLDEARKSEWWLKLSDKLQLALMNRLFQKIDLSMIRL